jgi:hypothetical protein
MQFFSTKENKMAKSSIHIEAGNIGFFSHNDRSRPTKNSIFSDEENFVSCSSKEAIELFKKELKIRSAAYLKNHPTRKKLHSKTHTHLSAIINLNKEHTSADLYKICEHLEETFDTKVLQYSIHKDEGHISDDGESIKNYHAHIEMMGLDSKGNSIKRQLHRKELIDLQSKTAELLGMERGTNYTREQKPRPKRLDTYEYKEAKEQESKAKKATKKDLTAEIKELRKALQEQGAVREQYAELEALNRELKQQIKNKDLTIDELQERLKAPKIGATTNDDKLKKVAEKSAELINKEKNKNKILQKELSEARETILKHEATITTQKDRIELLEANISRLEHKVMELESELKGYRGKYRQAKRKEINEAKQSLKSDVSELSSLISTERSEIEQDEDLLSIADLAGLTELKSLDEEVLDLERADEFILIEDSKEADSVSFNDFESIYYQQKLKAEQKQKSNEPKNTQKNSYENTQENEDDLIISP